VVAAVSALLNERLMEILGLSLALMALTSALIFTFSTKGEVKIAAQEDHIKTFKGEESGVVISAEAMSSMWVGSEAKAFGLENAEVVGSEPAGEGRVRLRFLGRYAGRSKGVRISIALTDPLRVFQKVEEVVHDGFVLDVLPRALLARASPRRLPVFGVGELPAGFPGPGQELYGLDYYHSSDTKDIVWKRVAKSPDEVLFARIRESNVKEWVKVGVLRLSEIGDGRVPWTDMLCEGLASLCKEVLETGAGVEVLYPAGDEVAVDRVRDSDDLAETVMSCSASPPARELPDAILGSDILVTGLGELRDGRVARVASSKPTLLISEDGASQANRGDMAVVYASNASLFPLVRRVLER
jgi:uncharacterized protein (DUF58 family)